MESFNGGLFTPDGAIEQVDFANECAAVGSPTVALICRDGLIFATLKKVESKLTIGSSVKKIFQVSETIGVAYSGLHPDFRVLLISGHKIVIKHFVLTGVPIKVFMFVKELAMIMQDVTHRPYVRPYGVNLLVGGLDVIFLRSGKRVGCPYLFRISANGDYKSLLAGAVGSNAVAMECFLATHYTVHMGEDEAITLAKNTLWVGNGDYYPPEHLEISVINFDFYSPLTQSDILLYHK